MLSVAAVAGGAFAARPTGIAAVDVAWSAALAAGAAFAGLTAPTLALLAVAGASSVAAGSSLSLGCAVAAVVIAALNASRGLSSPRLAALAGGLIGLSLLSGSGPGDERWIEAASTTGLAVLLAVLGLLGMPRAERRRVLAGLGILAGVLVVCTAAGLVAGFQARSDADRGIDAFRVAQQAGTAADLQAATTAFEDAEGAFRAARGPLAGFGRLGRIVPILSQQLGAADASVDAAADAADAAAVALASIDLDAIGLRDGAVDLDAIRAAEVPVASLVDALVHTVDRLARIDRRVLVGPVSDALDEALDEARDAGSAVDRLHRAVEVTPALLGAERPTRYLVLFTTPVEARGRIGFPGSFALLQLDHGRISFERAGPIDVLNGTAFDQLALRIPPRAQPYLGYGVSRDWRSITLPSDGAASADLAVQLAAQSGMGQLDGVIYASPHALATMVGVLGDIPLPAVGAMLTEVNTVDFLTSEQYRAFPELGQQNDRKDLLVDVAEVVGSRLDQLALPRAQDLVARFGPLVAAGDLIVAIPDSVSPAAADLLADAGLDGGFPRPADRDADVVLVTQRNAVGNKIDLFLSRRLDYSVKVADNGDVTADLTVELTNSAPSEGEPPYLIGSALTPAPPLGTNRTTTLVYSRYPLVEITVDGETVLPPVLSDGLFQVYQVPMELGPGQTSTLRARFAGKAIGPAPYEVVVTPGGLLTPDEVTVHVADDRSGTEVDVTGTGRTPLCASLRPREHSCS